MKDTTQAEFQSVLETLLHSSAGAALKSELQRLEELNLLLLKSATELYASAFAVLLAEQAKLQAAFPPSTKLN